MCCYCFWGCDSLSARRLVESENVRGRRKTAFNRGGRGECPQRALRKLITAKGAKKSRAKDAKERCNHTARREIAGNAVQSAGGVPRTDHAGVSRTGGCAPHRLVIDPGNLLPSIRRDGVGLGSTPGCAVGRDGSFPRSFWASWKIRCGGYAYREPDDCG